MAQPFRTPPTPEELRGAGGSLVRIDLQNVPKTKDEPLFMYVLVSEKRMAAVSQRRAPKPRTQPERAPQHLLCDRALALPYSAGEGSGHTGTDATQRLPPAA